MCVCVCVCVFLVCLFVCLFVYARFNDQSDGFAGNRRIAGIVVHHGSQIAEVWPIASPGLEESLIRRIPTCSYKASEGLVEETECAVCLGEFEEGDALRLLPKCNHAFHTSCIDTWLQSNSTCPLCRINIGLAAGLPHALMPLHLLPHLEAHDHMNPSSATVEEEADHHHSSSTTPAERCLRLSELSEFWSSSNSSQLSFVTGNVQADDLNPRPLSI